MFQHEEVAIRRGSRSGLPIIVAIHSRALGSAIGDVESGATPTAATG